MTTLPNDAREVLDFWFGAPGTPEHGTQRQEWFRKDPAFDARIAQRFETLVERALDGGLRDWDEAGADAALARILVLDQFPRNIFRGSGRSFAGDALAQQAAQAMVAAGRDLELPPVRRWFVYLPYEHAESVPLQDEAVRLFAALIQAEPALSGVMDYVHRHRDIILRFGRFPHRNEWLGRASTPEELAFLKEPGSSF